MSYFRLINLDISFIKRTFCLLYILVLLIYSVFDSNVFYFLENNARTLTINQFLISNNLQLVGVSIGFLFLFNLNRIFKKKIIHRYLMHGHNNTDLFILILLLIFLLSFFSVVIYCIDNLFIHYFYSNPSSHFTISPEIIFKYLFLSWYSSVFLLFLYLVFGQKLGHTILFLVLLYVAEKLLYRNILPHSEFQLPLKSINKYCSMNSSNIWMLVYFLFFLVGSFWSLRRVKNWL